MCLPLTSMTSLPSGNEASSPMATITSLLIATPPLNVASGVTTQPPFITKSAAIILPFFGLSIWNQLIALIERSELANRLALAQVRDHILFACLDMAAHDRYGSRCVALVHGRQQAQMLLMRGGAAAGIVYAVGAPFEDDALENVAQHVLQRFVAA